jgi:hypothetical protein
MDERLQAHLLTMQRGDLDVLEAALKQDAVLFWCGDQLYAGVAFEHAGHWVYECKAGSQEYFVDFIGQNCTCKAPYKPCKHINNLFAALHARRTDRRYKENRRERKRKERDRRSGVR